MSVHRGGVWSRVGLQFFGGGSPIFLGGFSNFSGGLQFFFFFFFFNFFPPKFLLGCTNPPPPISPEMVNAWPVRILLECILVKYQMTLRWIYCVIRRRNDKDHHILKVKIVKNPSLFLNQRTFTMNRSRVHSTSQW